MPRNTPSSLAPAHPRQPPPPPDEVPLAPWSVARYAWHEVPWRPILYSHRAPLSHGFTSGHILYRCEFVDPASRSLAGGRALALTVNVRHRCALWLNGHPLGGHTSYRSIWEIIEAHGAFHGVLHNIPIAAATSNGGDNARLGGRRYPVPPHMLRPPGQVNELVIVVESFGLNRQTMICNDVRNPRGLVFLTFSRKMHCTWAIAGVDVTALSHPFATLGIPREADFVGPAGEQFYGAARHHRHHAHHHHHYHHHLAHAHHPEPFSAKTLPLARTTARLARAGHRRSGSDGQGAAVRPARMARTLSNGHSGADADGGRGGLASHAVAWGPAPPRLSVGAEDGLVWFRTTFDSPAAADPTHCCPLRLTLGGRASAFAWLNGVPVARYHGDLGVRALAGAESWQLAWRARHSRCTRCASWTRRGAGLTAADRLCADGRPRAAAAERARGAGVLARAPEPAAGARPAVPRRARQRQPGRRPGPRLPLPPAPGHGHAGVGMHIQTVEVALHACARVLLYT